MVLNDRSIFLSLFLYTQLHYSSASTQLGSVLSRTTTTAAAATATATAKTQRPSKLIFFDGTFNLTRQKEIMAKDSKRKHTKSSSSASPDGTTTKKAKNTKMETPSEIIKRHQDEAIEQLRKEKKTETSGDDGCYDDEDDNDQQFDVMFSTVRALIGTNNEIWERCTPYYRKLDTSYGVGGNKTDLIRFYRVGYFTVDVHKSWYHQDMTFTTSSKLEVRNFKPFPSLPTVLTNIFSFGEAQDLDGIFSNYEKYLTKITYSEKRLAFQFLSTFKKHLEDVHVALGEIEAWITEPLHTLDFINTQFREGQDLVIPKLEDIPTKDCRGADEHSICKRCFYPCGEHTKKRAAKYYYCCPNNGRSAQISDCSVKQLKTVPFMKFNVSLATDQDRLKRFMAFTES